MFGNNSIAALIFNIAYFIIFYSTIIVAFSIHRKVIDYLRKKSGNRIPFVVLFILNASIVIFILFPLARLLLNFVPSIFASLGSKLAPDYFIGMRPYSAWNWLGMFVFPILIFIFWRGVVQKNKHNFEFKGVKKRFILVVVTIVILVSFGYIAYAGRYFLQGLEQVTPGDRIEENIVIDKLYGYSIVLYPRNGIWGKQKQYMSLPTSEGGYNLSVYIGEKRLLNNEEYFYSNDMGFLPLEPGGTEKIENILCNNIKWVLFKYFVEPVNNPEIEAVGIFQERIVLLVFSYRDWESQDKAVKAESDFKKMVGSFRFINN